MRLFSVVLLLLPGCSTAQGLTGPETARGQEMGSLMVACHYDSGWKTHKKYWCRGAQWSSCRTLVTTKSEQLVKKDRVSIKDNQKSFVFTVTMENLRGTDAGTYWCGIERIGADHSFEVNVFIDPGTGTSARVMRTTTTGLTSTSPPTETTTSDQPVAQTSPPPGSLLNSIFFQILVFLELPLLLSMLSAVAWVNRPQRCSEGRLNEPGENQ